MAAVLATALTFGSFPAFPAEARALPRRRPFTLVCRWARDPETGHLSCVWEAAPEPRRRARHLKLVWG